MRCHGRPKWPASELLSLFLPYGETERISGGDSFLLPRFLREKDMNGRKRLLTEHLFIHAFISR